MKLVSLIDYLGFITVRFFSLLFRLIPISFGLWIGRRIGQLAYYANRKRRSIAYRNLKAAFGAELSQSDIKGIIKRMYQNLAQMLVEVLTFPRINKKYIDKYVAIDGIEHLEAAVKRGKGIIFLTGHFGNWELCSVAGAARGYPSLVLAREQKLFRLNDLLNEYRELMGCKVIKKGFALRDILLALRNNSIIGMLVDQDAGKKGVFVDFFGRKTSTAHGPMSFALKTDATILPTFMVRQKGPYHKASIRAPLEIEKTEDQKANIRNGLQEFANMLESYIRKYPDQWLWVHKRWKSTPTRRILILDDGKAGHLNQSIAVAEIIQEHRKHAQYAIRDTQYAIVDVRFKNKPLRNLLNIGSVFSCRYCQGCMQCLKFCLRKDSYEKLMGAYADVIISCGASTEGVNLLLSRELNAKSVIIMKPSMAGIKRFDLVIAPKHDRAKVKKNLIVTEGAPNRITDERLKSDSAALAKRIESTKPLKIGIFIGGDNPEFRLTPGITNELVDAVGELAEDLDAEILVTTSRRTPKKAEAILKERLGKNSRCKLLIIANENNIDEAVGGILGLSRIVIVSCESISMISEALAAPNHTVIFELEKKKEALSKHELFLRNILKDSYATIVKPVHLADRVKELWEEKPPVKRLDDREKIYEAVKKLV